MAEESRTYVAAEESLPELTLKALLLGVVVAALLGAANAYLGFKAGQTVSATFPAAVLAIAAFRLPFFRGSVLEQNTMRTAASVGEALAAGAIFTVPAFVMVNVGGQRLWTGFNYWETSLILAVGGIKAALAEADAVMVARGDLGVELPPEDVPMLQKRIIRRCNDAGKPVIVATQMLESMIGAPAPTRAETSDVANAVVDGCDAVMLSGETSIGSYPVEAVEIMNRIIVRVEADQHGLQRVLDRPLDSAENRRDALGRAACILAEQMNAAAIVTLTHSGQTARVLARYRPDPPLVALTLSAKTLRLLSLVWGVRGMMVGQLSAGSDAALQQIQEELARSGVVQRGQYVVLLAGQPLFARGSTNFIKVERIE